MVIHLRYITIIYVITFDFIFTLVSVSIILVSTWSHSTNFSNTFVQVDIPNGKDLYIKILTNINCGRGYYNFLKLNNSLHVQA